MADETMSIVKSVSQRLVTFTFMGEEREYLYSIDHKIEKLQLDLEWCRHILETLADEKIKNSYLDSIRSWISQIREFAYEAGEILDKYSLLISRSGGGDGCCTCTALGRCCRCDCQGKAVNEIHSRIDAMSSRVLELASKMRSSGIRASSPNWIYTRSGEDTNNNQMREYENSWSTNEATSTVNKLAEHLVDPDGRGKGEVAVIYGQPGSGRTTLAKMVCRRDDVREHFDCFVWVPPNVGSRKVLEGVWLELHGGDYYEQRKKIGGTELDKLKSMIKVALRLKKLLVVLDDIRDEGPSLDVLRAVSSLINSSTGSKLMLITSSDVVQRMTISDKDFYRPELSEEQSKALLKKVVSQQNRQISTSLPDHGDSVNRSLTNMSQRCKDNPLAIIVLGGILAHKDTEEWEEFCNSTVKKIRQDSVLHDVMELSFSELHPHLKPYLLHVGNLPRDIQIPANKLYRIWNAEGLIRSSPPKSLEDIARDYLNELVQRGLVEEVSRGKTGKVRAFRVHDIMRRICSKKAAEVSCHVISSRDIVNAVNTKKSDTEAAGKSDTKATPPQRPVFALANTLSTRVMHGLAIRVDDDRGDHAIRNVPFPDDIVKNCRHLQSLFFLPNNSDGRLPRGWLRSLVGGSMELRVLHVENATISALPEHIGRLVHLKYLSLRGTTVAHELPASIGELSLLETLDLRVFPSGKEIGFLGIETGSNSVVLPDVFWKLRKLRHLYLPESYVCSRFARKLHVDGLTNLKTLKNLILRLCKVKGLKELTALRKFTWKVDNTEDTFELSDKKILMALLSCPYVNETESHKKELVIKLDGEMLGVKYVLDGFTSVKGMVLMGPLTLSAPLPSGWEPIKPVLENLTTLVFRRTELNEDPMPILGDLANLKNLRLSYFSFTEKRIFCGAGKFPELLYLKLDMLSELEDWTGEDGAMPKLKLVEIEYCVKLQKYPNTLAQGVKVHCLLPCVPGDRIKHGPCPHSEKPRGSTTDGTRAGAAGDEATGA